GLQAFVVGARERRDVELRRMAKALAQLRKRGDAAKAATMEQAIARRRAELEADVEAMRHDEPGSEDESAFDPIETDVVHHDYAFPDGEHVKLADRVQAYATTAPRGVYSEDPVDHAEVKEVMGNSGLSPSRARILQAISGFEGGFDSVNTFDKAKV